MSSVSPTTTIAAKSGAWRELFSREDWWAIWIGLGLVVAAVIAFANGSSIKWLAVTPQKWSTFADVLQQLSLNATRYVSLFILWLALFGIAAAALGIRLAHFVPAFSLLFIVTTVIYFIGVWERASYYSLEPPLVALLFGLIVSNVFTLPAWLQSALRVEFYVKTGIVLLGAGVPIALILWAGPVAIVQAAIISLATFFTIYFVAKKLGLDQRLAAVLGVGGSVCGVSAAIAVGGAVGAKKEHVSITITVVFLWAIVMVFVLPLLAKSFGLSTGVAGAWIGTSEFADAAGFAAAQTYAGYAGQPGISGTGDAAVQAFTLMKVIGRDLWIGVWALALSIVAATRWQSTGVVTRTSAGEIWKRFPKFVLGFFVASIIVTLVAHGLDFAAYKKILVPDVVAPLQGLRTWAFTFCFLSIALTTRLRDLSNAGAKPFYAFTAGVVVNLILGYILSTQVFAGFWTQLGQP
jgi:uncharacterized integral membrane protein (TIGR00698 family)